MFLRDSSSCFSFLSPYFQVDKLSKLGQDRREVNMQNTTSRNLVRSQALASEWINTSSNQALANVLAILGGCLGLSLLAQVSITLPWTPIPITGQTFGVALMALSLGRNRAISSFVVYTFVGWMGIPVFALGRSGLTIGPTLGYLVGMFLACALVGSLADRGYAKKFTTAWLSCFAGSLVVFACGVIGLSFFLPSDKLLMAGVIPFLPGDIIKNILAATIVSGVATYKSKK